MVNSLQCDGLTSLRDSLYEIVGFNKIHDLASGFQAQLGMQSLSQNFEKIKFLRLYFIFVTYLLREVDERTVSAKFIYF